MSADNTLPISITFAPLGDHFCGSCAVFGSTNKPTCILYLDGEQIMLSDTGLMALSTICNMAYSHSTPIGDMARENGEDFGEMLVSRNEFPVRGLPYSKDVASLRTEYEQTTINLARLGAAIPPQNNS